jgi:hypothetical protein
MGPGVPLDVLSRVGRLEQIAEIVEDAWREKVLALQLRAVATMARAERSTPVADNVIQRASLLRSVRQRAAEWGRTLGIQSWEKLRTLGSVDQV